MSRRAAWSSSEGEVDAVLRRFLTGMPQRFEVASGDAVIEGLRLELNPATGFARRVARLRHVEEERSA